MIARRFQTFDFGLAVGALLVALARLVPGPAALDLPLRAAAPLFLELGVVLGCLRAAEAYAFPVREGTIEHSGRVACAGAAALLAGLAGALALRDDAIPALQVGSLLSAVLLSAHLVYRLKVLGWRAAGRLTPNLVFVGATPNARRLIEAALKTRDAAVLGVFDDRMSRSPSEVHGVPVLGDTESLLTHRLLPFIDRIVITVTPGAQKRVREIIDRLRPLPNAITLLLDYEGEAARHRALSRLADAPLAQVAGAVENDGRAAAKRAQDLVLATVLIALLAPLMLLIALLVRLDSAGPVLFRQKRHGFNNEIIEVLKFRTMRTGDPGASARDQVRPDDPRVTRLGRILRRLSLDELPQLINVVAGEMSLVGPRPHAIGMKAQGMEAARLVGDYAWRHRMKPGLTGWAQIKGSVGPVDTPELVRRRVALDIDYIERQSLWLDLRILLATPLALIRATRMVR